MALEPAQADAVVGPYRQIVSDLQGRGTAAPEIAEMAWAAGEMDRKAALHDDMGAFVAEITNDGLFQRFNDAYSRLMAAWAQPAALQPIVLPGPPIPSDEELQDRLIKRLQSVAPLMARHPDGKHLVPQIEELITISERGASHPVVLRHMAERGLDLAVHGIVHSRPALLEALERHRSAGDEARARLAWDLVAAFDELYAASRFGVPDPLAFELRRIRIEWGHAPAVATQDALVPRVRHIVELVVDWLDAHCSFAATDPRFLSVDGEDATQRAIDLVRQCNPVFLARRERLLVDTWGLAFDAAVDYVAAMGMRGELPWSDERMELARRTRPVCQPAETPPVELIDAAQQLHRAAAPEQAAEPAATAGGRDLVL